MISYEESIKDYWPEPGGAPFDPNKALHTLRLLYETAGPSNIEQILAIFCALDTWLIEGNELPEDWTVNR